MRNSTLKLFGLFGILILQLTNSYCQTSTLSPYSRFGIGDLLFNGYAYQRGMGGVGIASTSETRLNFLNPASYAYDTLTNLELGFQGEYIQQKQANISAIQTNAGLNSLALGFPVLKNRIGMSFGLNPYVGTGYNILSREIIDTNNTVLSSKYEGSGGYTRYFVGIGGKLTKHLSAGLNASYLYGTVTKKRRADFSNTLFFNNQYITELTLSDFYLEFGLNWKQSINDKIQLAIGLSGAPSQTISAKRSTIWANYRYDSFGFDIFRDTILNQSNLKGSVTLPMYLGFGINLQQNDKWVVGLDLNYQDWKNFKSFENTDTLNNSFRVAIGGQITPNSKDSKYFNRVQYRAGFYYNQTSLEIKNNTLSETAVTIGLGFPLRKSLQSMINFGLEAGMKGTTKDNLVKEDFARIVIGLTFNELWFQKNRYD